MIISFPILIFLFWLLLELWIIINIYLFLFFLFVNLFSIGCWHDTVWHRQCHDVFQNKTTHSRVKRNLFSCWSKIIFIDFVLLSNYFSCIKVKQNSWFSFLKTKKFVFWLKTCIWYKQVVLKLLFCYCFHLKLEVIFSGLSVMDAEVSFFFFFFWI